MNNLRNVDIPDTQQGMPRTPLAPSLQDGRDNETPLVRVGSLRWRLDVAAALSLAAAMIHAAVVTEHWAEWWGFGAFFLSVTVMQAAFSLALIRWPRRSLFIVGLVINLALIVLYIITRATGLPCLAIITQTFGMPCGPDTKESIGLLELASKVIELELMVRLGVLLWIWPRARRQ